MDKTVILVSGICGDIGCSAVRSLRDSVDKLIGCDIRRYSPVLNNVDNFYVVPPASDIGNYINFLKGIIKKEDINYFLPLPEPELEVLNLHRNEMKLLGVKLLLNNKIILENFLDKFRTIQFLEDLDIKVPKTMPLSIYDESFGYPLMVKARKSCGGKKIWKIETPLDLGYIKQKDDGSLIAQEYIGNDDEDYTTGVFSDGRIVSSITFRRKLGYGGLSVEASLVEEPFLDHLSLKIAGETELYGSINIQSRRLGDKFIPYEINPRLSSTLLFRKQFGFDDAVWWLNIFRGMGYSYSKKYKSGIAVRCLSECYFDMEELEKNGD